MSDKKSARKRALRSLLGPSREPSEHETYMEEKKAKERKREEDYKETISVYADRIREYDRRIKDASSEKERDKLVKMKKKLEKEAHSDPGMKRGGYKSDKFYDISKK